MIFQHTIDKVLSGEKTQTRRVVKEGDYAEYVETEFTLATGVINFRATKRIRNANNNIRWEQSKTYSVQPGRGQRGVARIKIMTLGNQDVRYINKESMRAEGFNSKEEFLNLWRKMHGANYESWVITFKLVNDE